MNQDEYANRLQKLPLEKQLNVASFKNQVSRLGTSELQDMCVQLYFCYIEQQLGYQQLLKKAWNIETEEK